MSLMAETLHYYDRQKVSKAQFKKHTQRHYDVYHGDDMGWGFKITGVNNTGFRMGSYWFKWPTTSQLKQYQDGIQFRNGNWKEVELKTLPNQDPVSLNNFRNGSKAVKVMWKVGYENHNAYFTPNTIAGLRGMSRNNRKSNTLVMKAMEVIRHKTPREKLFKNPVTRNLVRRGDIRFVILKKKSPPSPSPATRRKLAANAANKRAAASKRKRSPNKSSRRT
jgi:hypothetical protein